MYQSTKELVKNDSQLSLIANEININKFEQSQQTALYMVVASKIPKDKILAIANQDINGIDMLYLKDVFLESPETFDEKHQQILNGN